MLNNPRVNNNVVYIHLYSRTHLLSVRSVSGNIFIIALTVHDISPCIYIFARALTGCHVTSKSNYTYTGLNSASRHPYVVEVMCQLPVDLIYDAYVTDVII